MPDDFAALRAEVDRHTGPARARPLLELSRALMDRYWRTGPGVPAAKRDLDELITASGEAYEYVEPGLSMHGQIAAQLGWMYAIRHTAHGGPDKDRETGIELLETALAVPGQLPAVLLATARMFLGQLLLSRLTPKLQGPDMAALMMGGAAMEGSADADRACVLFRAVLAEPGATAEITDAATTMLTLAEALQSMFGGPAAMDFGKLMKVFGAMQGFRAKAETAGFAFNPNGMLDLSQMPAGGRRPVAVVDGETPKAPDTPAPPRRRPPADPAPGPDAATLRAELQTLLPPGGLCALLDNHPVAGDDGRVDELVAIGSLLVETAEATPGDHLAYAVALTLRDSDDRARAAVHLRTAAGAAPGESPEFLLTALSLAIRLDAGSVLDESFGDVTAALRQIGAGALLVETPGGVLVLTAATGHLEPAAEDRALPERLLVVGTGPIAGRHTVSYVRSAAQVIVLARRGHRPVTADAVFVANPRRDRDRATMDALLLRRAYHPVSAGLGSTVEDVTGAATPDEVAARLDASLVHLGCGITPAGALELAGGTELPATRIAEPPAGARTGGVVLLPPAPAGTPALVDALLARGVSDVIAFREPVPDRVASLIYFLLHGRLVDEGLEPAQAVASVHDWLTDPERTVPEFLPADLRTAFPAYAEVVVCFGA